MRLISTSIKGYCRGFAFYTNPLRNPVLLFQYGKGHIILAIGRWHWGWGKELS